MQTEDWLLDVSRSVRKFARLWEEGDPEPNEDHPIFWDAKKDALKDPRWIEEWGKLFMTLISQDFNKNAGFFKGAGINKIACTRWIFKN